jgi:hypothetical protein
MELPGTGWCCIVGHKRQEVRLLQSIWLILANIQDALRAVVPLPLHSTSLKPSSLRAIFSSLAKLTVSDLPEPIPVLAPDISTIRKEVATSKGEDIPEEKEEAPETGIELDKEMIYMGIVTTDSTVVYYKLTKGIKKPADIPDE